MKSSEQITRTIPEHAFRSIGLPDAELMLLKSELHSAIKAAIVANGWNQKQAGERLGWGQPDVSKIMNDRFSQHSVERLIKAALDLGLTVSFGVAAAKSKREAGRVALVERVKNRGTRREESSSAQGGGGKAPVTRSSSRCCLRAGGVASASTYANRL